MAMHVHAEQDIVKLHARIAELEEALRKIAEQTNIDLVRALVWRVL